MKIKYMLTRNGRHVAFTIYKMDERFRATEYGMNAYTAENRMIVCSSTYPQLDSERIYLRGSVKSCDTIFATTVFATEDIAKDYEKSVHKALEEWSEKWEGFKESEEEHCRIVTL